MQTVNQKFAPIGASFKYDINYHLVTNKNWYRYQLSYE